MANGNHCQGLSRVVKAKNIGRGNLDPISRVSTEAHEYEKVENLRGGAEGAVQDLGGRSRRCCAAGRTQREPFYTR